MKEDGRDAHLRAYARGSAHSSEGHRTGDVAPGGDMDREKRRGFNSLCQWISRYAAKCVRHSCAIIVSDHN